MCGATNLSEGAVTAFSPLGSAVRMPTAPGGVLAISDTKVRGVQSSGMLCGLGELGLLPEGTAATQEIVALPGRISLGTPFDSAMLRPASEPGPSAEPAAAAEGEGEGSVRGWLGRLGKGKYAESFCQNFETLADLVDTAKEEGAAAILAECAVKGMGDKTVIRKAIEELVRASAQQDAPAADDAGDDDDSDGGDDDDAGAGGQPAAPSSTSAFAAALAIEGDDDDANRWSSDDDDDDDGGRPRWVSMILDSGDKGVKEMVDHGILDDVNARNPADGSTPLIIAAEVGALAGVRLLLTKGAEINAGRTSDNCTALVRAIAADKRDAVTALLAVEACDTNITLSDDGTTALLVACAIPNRGHYVEPLLQRGADPDIKGHDGKNAMALAKGLPAAGGRDGIVAKLVAHAAAAEPGSPEPASPTPGSPGAPEISPES